VSVAWLRLTDHVNEKGTAGGHWTTEPRAIYALTSDYSYGRKSHFPEIRPQKELLGQSAELLGGIGQKGGTNTSELQSKS